MKWLTNIRELLEDFFYARRRPIPNGLKAAALYHDDEELCWAAHKEACEALDRARGSYGSKVKYLPPPWRQVYTLIALDADVLNGGFHQFFTNAGGQYDSHLMEDIDEFGLYGLTEIASRAFKKYSEIDYSDQWKNRGKSWDYFVQPYQEGRFDVEDQDYYRFFDTESLALRIGRHVRQHFDLFA